MTYFELLRADSMCCYGKIEADSAVQSREQWIRLQETNVNIIWCKYFKMDIKPCVLYCRMDHEVELKGFIVVKCLTMTI